MLNYRKNSAVPLTASQVDDNFENLFNLISMSYAIDLKHSLKFSPLVSSKPDFSDFGIISLDNFQNGYYVFKIHSGSYLDCHLTDNSEFYVFGLNLEFISRIDSISNFKDSSVTADCYLFCYCPDITLINISLTPITAV